MRPGHTLLAVLLAVNLAACGGAAGTPTTPTPPASGVTAVVVSGWLSPLKAGQSVQLSATALAANGTTRSVTTEATWQTSNAAVAIVSAAGLVTAFSAGAVEIRATYEGKTGNLGLSVEPGDDPTGPLPGLRCGVERWAVKTLSDAAAAQVNLAPVHQTTIRALNERPTHCSSLPNTRTFPEEFEVYEVVGRVTFVRLEDDRDYHVAVADATDSSYTIVTEVVDIACDGPNRSGYRGVMEAARNGFISMLGGRSPSTLVGTTVRVRGVGFYDFNHGQIGRSRNCMELHPIIAISTP